MPGLLSFLSPALTTATNAVAANERAQADVATSRKADLVQQAAMQRQAEEQRIKQAIEDRQAKSAGILDQLNQYKVDHPAIDPLSPEGIAAKTGMDRAHTDYERTNGYHAPVLGSFEKVDTTGPDGKPLVGILDKHTGNVRQTDVSGKAPSAGAGGGAQGAVNAARLAAAGQQIANADDAMTAFENDVQAGNAQINAASMEVARKALSDSFGSDVAYKLLAERDPRLAAYIRSAKEAAVAERMITPRGGSNATMQAEKILMQGGAGGNSDLITQAQAYRKTLRHALPTGGATSHDAPAPAAAHPLDKYDLE